MDSLNDDFILSREEIDTLDLFSNEDEEDSSKSSEDNDIPNSNKSTSKETNKTTENQVSPDELFDSESVSSGDEEEKNIKDERASTSNRDGTSPNSDFYYSIANALVEDGVLSNLDQEFIKSIKTPEDFAEAIDKQVESRLTETQKRINEALNANLEPEEIRQYETVLNNLDKISEDNIKEESDKGESLRKQLIFQDLINRGFSKERAAREVKKSFDAGSDIEDAKDALESNKNFFKQQYNNLIEEGKNEAKEERDKLKKESEELRKQMLEDKEVFEGIEINKNLRKQAYDNIAKPIFKTEDGEYLTAIQKYELDNPVEFRKKLGIIFTLTNGFKNIDSLIKNKVNKAVKNNLRELEHTLKNSNRPKGDPKFVGLEDSDTESYDGKGWSLDV